MKKLTLLILFFLSSLTHASWIPSTLWSFVVAGGGLQLSHDVYMHNDEMNRATLALTSVGSGLAITGGITGMIDGFNSASFSSQSLINLTLASIGYLTAYTIQQQRKQNKKIDIILALLQGSRGSQHDGPVVTLEAIVREQQAMGRSLAAIQTRLESADLNQCTVCMEPLIGGQRSMTTKSLSCGHIFHGPCIDPWLAQHPQCPACREQHRPSNTPPQKKHWWLRH